MNIATYANISLDFLVVTFTNHTWRCPASCFWGPHREVTGMRKSLRRHRQFPATTYDLWSLSSFVSWDGKFLAHRRCFWRARRTRKQGALARSLFVVHRDV